MSYGLEKTWKFTQPKPTFQNQNFESTDELGEAIS